MDPRDVARLVTGRTVRLLVSPARFGRFFAVGVVGALCDNLLLAGLHGGLAVPLAPAKVASAEAAILLMFAINERWTFADEGRTDPVAVARRLVTSNAVRLVGLAVGLGVLLALVELGVWYLVANVVGLGVGFVANYLFESLLTWQVHRG